MGQYNTIFLIASPTLRHTPAFDYASHMAKAIGARLHICVFDHSETIAALQYIDKKNVEVAKAAYIGVRRAWACDEAALLRAQRIDATGDAAWARPIAEEILAQVAEIKPDIVIKDAQHEPLLNRIFFTPVDWQLLRLCPAPLLLVNSAASDLPRRIFAAIDPLRTGPDDADFNNKIVHEALTLAIQCGAEMHLVSTFNPNLGVADGEAIFTAELYDALRLSHQQLFSDFCNEHGVPAACHHIVQGSPAWSLGEIAASSHADVLVVGSTYRKGLERLLLGSTAESIFEHARCNIFAVKPEGFAKKFDEYMQRAQKNNALAVA